jgi:hypothetical protein
MAELNIGLSNVEAQESLKPLAPGWYEAEITDSELKQGAKGTYIRWTFDIIGHPNKVWEIMSLNPDGEAVGLKKLKTLAVVSGHPDPNFIRDTDEFHGKRCQVRLKIEEDATGAYEPKNKISAFKPSSSKVYPAIVAEYVLKLLYAVSNSLDEITFDVLFLSNV